MRIPGAFGEAIWILWLDMGLRGDKTPWRNNHRDLKLNEPFRQNFNQEVIYEQQYGVIICSVKANKTRFMSWHFFVSGLMLKKQIKMAKILWKCYEKNTNEEKLLGCPSKHVYNILAFIKSYCVVFFFFFYFLLRLKNNISIEINC